MSVHPKAREAVRLASTRTELEPTALWLRRDEYGTFAQLASRLLVEAAAQPIAATMTEAEILEAVADRILLVALEAELRREQKGATA